MKFNKKQEQAINHKEGACVVIAGAGSGKSTVIVNRIKELTQSNINNIIAITFTNNSADDLKRKLDELGIHNVNSGTFHKVCGRILNMEGIYSKEKLKAYEIENLFNKLYTKSKVDVEEVLGFIGYQKSYMRSYKDEFLYKETKYTTDELREFYRAYEEFKKGKGIIDLDDVLLKTYEVLVANPDKYRCDYLLCDEQQDSNSIQNKLIRELCPSGNIMVVGDYRQSIYGFRGAVPQLFMDFDKE
jgi:DNA helicase-2/ATP-dependent DNA helicase PcrA